MARLQLSVDIEGEDRVIGSFDVVRGRVDNLRKPMDAIGVFMMNEIDDNYGMRGRMWGRWRRRKKAYAHPLLELTGAMRGGFTKRVTSSSVTIGNKTTYFKYHQSKATRRVLPRRVMMAIEEDQRREVTRIMQRHVMRG